MKIQDFDEAVESAWREFRADLADRIAEVPVGAEMVVAQSDVFPEGPHGAIRFTLTRARRLRATVSLDDLHPDPTCRSEQITTMTQAQWRLLRDGRLIFETGRRRADEIAVVAVGVLCEVWDVVHPALLAGDADAVREGLPAGGGAPETRDELREWVCRVIETISHRSVEVDEDGDIVLSNVGMHSWLRISGRGPVLEFFGTVVHEVADVPAAKEYIAGEGAALRHIKLALRGTSLIAFMNVDVPVFHPRNVEAALERWFDLVSDTAPKIVAALASKGQTVDDEDDRLPEPLQTVIVLDADCTTLSASEVAEICRYDQSAILTYITLAQTQWISWLTSESEADAAGDRDEAAACRHEAQAWDATTDKLRAALRMVVLGGRNVRG